MEKLKEKIKLLRRRRSQRLENKPLWPSRENLNYLRHFFQKQRRLLYASLAFLFGQGLLEVALIMISHRYLKNSGLELAVDYRALLILLILTAGLYLFCAYAAIKSERTLIVRLINDLRSRWFKLFLNKRPEEYDLENKGALLTKISYHLPLLSTGLTNSLAGFIRWLLFVAILLFLAFVFGVKLLLFAAAAIMVSLLIGFGAYWVSYHYVTRETTFYSQLLRLVDLNLSDWHFVKTFRRERAIKQEFDDLVNLDSYFRVRRDLWLRFSLSLIFVLLIFFSFTAGVWNSQLEYFFGSASLDARFIMIVAIVYFSRLLYESARIGLYSVPLCLGLVLSVPQFSARQLGMNRSFHADKLIFASAKSKLFRRAGKYRRFLFEFTPGGRYLFTGSPRSGRSALAKLFTGRAVYGRRAWLVKTGQKRYFYKEFFDKYAGFYYLDPAFTSVRSLLETVSGKEKTAVSTADLATASNLVNQYPELHDIFFEKEDWRFRTDKFCVNAKNTLLIQIIYCLLHRPYLIAVDNFWLEREDPEIFNLLRLLGQLLPETIIVVFAQADSSLFAYRAKYEI